MGRKFDLCVLLTLAIACFVFWLRQPPVIYTQPLSPKYKITIRRLPAANPDKVTLRITYHYPPGIGMYVVREQTIKRPTDRLTFSHVVDPGNRLQCIHDNNGVGFLLLFDENTDDLWHTTNQGENWGGWRGTYRSVWQERLDALREEFPSVPYTSIPD